MAGLNLRGFGNALPENARRRIETRGSKWTQRSDANCCHACQLPDQFHSVKWTQPRNCERFGRQKKWLSRH